MAETKIVDLFGFYTKAKSKVDWAEIVSDQNCPYLNRACVKVRKSQPDIAIGTCTVLYGSKEPTPVIICPHRLLERRQIFTDCLHLLTSHEPGNELHIIPEVSIPGGSIDYFLVSVRDKKVCDFVGIELQTLDSTGTIWPERQRFLKSVGLSVASKSTASTKTFGMNWKMTAKTILVQLHHKIETFEHVHKHLAVVIQDHLLEYMRREFSFSHLVRARLGDPMHFHAYRLEEGTGKAHLRLALVERLSTDIQGIANCLGLQASPKVELAEIVKVLEGKLNSDTFFALQPSS